jgi:hypothetical protein
MGTVSPMIEGRLSFITDVTPPVITIFSPVASTYLHSDLLPVNFTVTDDNSGVKSVMAFLDGAPVANGDVIDLHNLALGDHTFTVYADDKAGNYTSASVTFSVTTSVSSLIESVMRFYDEGEITASDVYASLLDKLYAAQAAIDKAQYKTAINVLNAFINSVKAQRGKTISIEAADLLLGDAYYVIGTLPAK